MRFSDIHIGKRSHSRGRWSCLTEVVIWVWSAELLKFLKFGSHDTGEKEALKSTEVGCMGFSCASLAKDHAVHAQRDFIGPSRRLLLQGWMHNRDTRSYKLRDVRILALPEWEDFVGQSRKSIEDIEKPHPMRNTI